MLCLTKGEIDMNQNYFMYEWQKHKQYYDTLSDGSIHLHENAPERIKQSYAEYERIMGKVNEFPKRKTSFFSFASKAKDNSKNDSEKHAVNIHDTNIKPIFDQESKKAILKDILDALPEWFGIEAAKQEYIDEGSNLPFWAYYENQQPVGFIAVKKHTNDSAEIYVMGVLKEYQHRHIGTFLVKECENWCRMDNIKYLQVKTVSEDSPDEYYAKTRLFYTSVGFSSLEVMPDLWDECNPCLIMVKKLS